jgi:hypothetical protein
MFNLPPIKPQFLFKDDENGALSLSEKVIYWTIVLTPVWWLMGIQPIFYPAVVIGLLVIHFDIDKLLRERLPACAWAWLMMAIVMLWTALLGLNDTGFGLMKAAATLVTLKAIF